MSIPLDPFASNFDTATSIGAIASHGPCNCSACEELDFAEHIAGLIEDEVFDDDDDEDEQLDAIGSCVACSSDSIGAKKRKARRAARKERRKSKPKKKLFGKIKLNTKKALETVKKVNRHPVTGVAIAATASAAPPFGAAAAGAATAGLAMAEGVLRAVEKGKAIANKFCPKAICKNKKPKGSLQDAKAAARIMATLNKSAKTKSVAKPANVKVVAKKPISPKIRPKTSILARKGVVKKAAQKIVAVPSMTALEIRNAALELVKVMRLAAEGDKEANAAMVTIQLIASKEMREAQEYLKLKAQGVASGPAHAAARIAADRSDADWAKVVAEAERFLGADARPKVNLKEVRELAKAGAQKLEAYADQAAAERGPVKGLLVTTPGKIIDRRRNGVEKGLKGSSGYLVLSTGRAIPGLWSA